MEMRYPNAAKGLKVLFWARILSLVTSIPLGMGLASRALHPQLMALQPQAQLISLLLQLLPTLVFGGVGILGLNLARREHKDYALAMWLSLLSLLLELAGPFLPVASLPSGSQALSVWEILTLFLTVGTVYCVCIATAQLLRELGQEKLAELGDLVWKTNLGLGILSLISPFFSQAGSLADLLEIFSIVAAAAWGIIVLIQYLYFLWKSAGILGTAAQPAPAEEG